MENANAETPSVGDQMPDVRKRFSLSSADCELLLEFEMASSLHVLADRFGRDHSIVSRHLKRIADEFAVVEKLGGKWVLTDLGRKLNEVTRESILLQASVLGSHSILRIGTNREFAARILAPDLAAVQKLFPKTQIEIKTFEHGAESALLQGRIDLAIDCGRPMAPDVAYKLVLDEPIDAVASKAFVKKHRGSIATGKVFTLPHLLCDRLHPDKILEFTENPTVIAAMFNDIATTRAACLGGAGWALLPRYAIQAELDSGQLVVLQPEIMKSSKYGVWWPRSRRQLKGLAEHLIQWLQSKHL